MRTITFKLKSTGLNNAEQTLGPRASWDGTSQNFHPLIEGDALDIVWRGGGFPNNTVSGEDGEYVAFYFDPTKTVQENIHDILDKNSNLEIPDTDAWWPLISGNQNENTDGLSAYALINPSNPPLEKREGFGDRRFPVLIFRTKEKYGTPADSWYLTTIGAEEDGHLAPYVREIYSCLIYFKKKAPLSPWKYQLELYEVITGKPYYKGGKRPEPKLTEYGKMVLAKMDTRNRPDMEVTLEGLSKAEQEILEAINGNIVSRKTFKTLVEFAAKQCIGKIRVIGPDTVASFQDDFSYSGKGGSAYYSTLYVWHFGQMKEKSYQWRDAYSSSNDKPWLRIHDIDPVKSKIEGNQVTLCLGSRSVTLTFDQPMWTCSKVELAREIFAEKWDPKNLVEKVKHTRGPLVRLALWFWGTSSRDQNSD